MIVVDANLLLYAYDPSSRHHKPARVWLENTLSAREHVGLAWMILLAFFVSAQARARWNIHFRPLKLRRSFPDGSTVRWLRS